MDLSEKTIIVKLSGGKDSTATLLYMLEHHHVDYVVYQHIPDNMLPESRRHVEELVRIIEEETGEKLNLVIIESEPMLKLMREKHKPFPNPKTLWCGYWLKLVPFRRWLRALIQQAGLREEDIVIAIGVKRSDSPRRNKMLVKPLIQARELKTSYKRVALDPGHYYIYAPLLDWSDQDVWRYLERYPRTLEKIKQAYTEYPNLSACLVCPYHSLKFYRSTPRPVLEKILSMLEEIREMEHITRFRLGYQLLLKHIDYVKRVLSEKEVEEK